MLATREAYGKALAEFGAKYENLIVLDADLSKSTKTAEFKNVFPERFFNMGISEADMIGTAAGLSTCGKVVFASTFAMFAAGRAYEQIRNSVAYPKLNVKIAATHAGISVGEDGASHQCIEDLALMRVIPNMTVLSPADGVETRAAIEWAINYDGPVYIRLARLKAEEVNAEDYKFEIGKAVNLKEGTDITIIATGLMVSETVKAAKLLEEAGISVNVINIHTIKPLDKNAIIEAAKKTNTIFTVEEHNIVGGLGSAVSEVTAENYPTKVIKIGVNDTFGKSGKGNELLEEFGLTGNKIAERIKKELDK